MQHGEDSRAAARRELREELGLDLRLEDLRHVGRIAGDWDYRRDTVDIFEVVLEAEPLLKIDNREIVAAWFVSPDELLGAQPVPCIEAFFRSHPRTAPVPAIA